MEFSKAFSIGLTVGGIGRGRLCFPIKPDMVLPTLRPQALSCLLPVPFAVWLRGWDRAGWG